MSNQERRGLSYPSREKNRASETAVSVVASIAFIAVTVGVIGYVAVNQEGESQRHYNERVVDEIKDLVVDSLPNEETPLRSELSLADDDIVGVVKPGTPVRVIEVPGPVYPTGQSDLEIEIDGEKYGRWFKLVDPVIITTEDGEQAMRLGFIVGNFLKKPSQDELIFPTDSD